MHQQVPPRLRAFARSMRNDPTKTESELWQRLRGRKLAGLKFRRQVPLAGYILDFICFEAGLAIELDGSQHLNSRHDAKRDQALRERGIETIRFENDEVIEDIDSVCFRIGQFAKRRLQENPSPAISNV